MSGGANQRRKPAGLNVPNEKSSPKTPQFPIAPPPRPLSSQPRAIPARHQFLRGEAEPAPAPGRPSASAPSFSSPLSSPRFLRALRVSPETSGKSFIFSRRKWRKCRPSVPSFFFSAFFSALSPRLRVSASNGPAPAAGLSGVSSPQEHRQQSIRVLRGEPEPAPTPPSPSPPFSSPLSSPRFLRALRVSAVNRAPLTGF